MQSFFKNFLVPSIRNSAISNLLPSFRISKMTQPFIDLKNSIKDNFKTTDLYKHITGEIDYQRYMDSLDKQMQYNSAEAEKNRQFQEYMSNSAYQRQMEDLRKSGINPMLVINSGGATTPSGSSASVNSSYNGNSAASVMSALSLGVNASTSILNQSIRSITQLASSGMSLFGSLARTGFYYDKLGLSAF